MIMALHQQSTVARLAAPGKTALSHARIAIVHYWFVNHRGGERVIESIASMFPQADIFSLVVDPDSLPASLRTRAIHTSFLQNIPGGTRWHRRFLPLYPLALEQFDLAGYDLVLSSESGPAKGVLTSAKTCHVCYCHSPMRYLWDFYHRYKNGSNFGSFSRPFFTLASHYLRVWDSCSANRVDYFVANSRNVASRIRKHYRRDSAVIYPPVEVGAGYISGNTDDYYLAVGQLVDYKRFDLTISACNRLGRQLHIVGDGEQYSRLRRLAGSTIHFLGALSDADLREEYAHCRALLFPGEEDFGMVPVEALSFGRPVIAYGCGGVTETVYGFYADAPIHPGDHSGVFFREQSVESLIQALEEFERAERHFSRASIKQQAERFSPQRFQTSLSLFLAEKWEEFQHAL